MKTVISFVSLISCLSASASQSRVILDCNVGASNSVKISVSLDQKFEATLQVQSFGDSFQTFHYAKVGAYPQEYTNLPAYIDEHYGFQLLLEEKIPAARNKYHAKLIELQLHLEEELTCTQL